MTKRGKVNESTHLQPKTANDVEDSMINALDDLASYETFLKDVPAELRRALVDKLPPEDIYKKFSSWAAIRAVQIVATEKDSGKALAAVKELLDRTYGKAVERKQIKHQLEDLSDKELDALLLSELSDETEGEE